MPVRYVTAVALAVALLSVAFVGVGQFAENNTESQMESEVAEVAQTATLLYENEEVPPPGQQGAQRLVTVTLPDDSLTSDRVDYFRIERLAENASVIRYQVDGGPEREHHLDVPIVSGNDESIELTGTDATHELVLLLEADEDRDPVVNVRRMTTEFELVVETEHGGEVEVDGPPSQGSVETTYFWGDEVTLTADPDSPDGWFTGWRGDVPHSTQNETVTITMNGHRNVTATFQTYVVEVDVDHDGPGDEVTGTELYEDGTLVDSEDGSDLPHVFDVEPVTEGNSTTYNARAHVMGIVAAEEEVTVEHQDAGTVELDAEEYVTRTYTVTDGGDPVEGATVEVSGDGQQWRNVTAGEDGEAEVELQPSALNVPDGEFEVRVDGDLVETIEEQELKPDNLEDTVEVEIS